MKFWERLDDYSFPRAWLNYLALPGRIILWLHYMTASGGAARSARQARSPAMIVFYSTIFYAVALFAIVALAASSG